MSDEADGAEEGIEPKEVEGRGGGEPPQSRSAPSTMQLSVRLLLLAVLLGAAAGLGAVAFRGLIALVHNLAFLGKWSFSYDANVHTPAGPFGPFIILAPVLGAVAVVYLVKNYAPEAKGHGVPEVMEAVYYVKGHVRPIVGLIKSVASAISIGTGGSIGREGPFIQIGGSLGSTLGQIFKVPVWERITLVAAGAGGGIAAAFNSPIGGILFAIEILMHEVSVRTLVPVGLATVTATYVARLFFGPNPSFVIPSLVSSSFHLTDPVSLLAFVGLGIVTGVISAVYIKTLYGFEDFFEQRIKSSYYLRHTLGMLGVGITMYLSYVFLGHYYVEGVGYATIQDILQGSFGPILILLLLAALKLLVTDLTLGSGASGGVFSPGLFMGATIGAAYGTGLQWVFPGLAVGPPAFAVAGMAGIIGGSTGAAMTAVVMIFEMTRDYTVIIPMAITVTLSYAVRWAMQPESIYTLKVARRGKPVPQALQANFFYIRHARDVMATNLGTVSASTSFARFLQSVREHGNGRYFLVGDPDRVFGLIPPDAVRDALAGTVAARSVHDLATRGYVTVSEDTTVFEVLTRMRRAHVSVALVKTNAPDPNRGVVIGVITKEQLADTVQAGVELFAD